MTSHGSDPRRGAMVARDLMTSPVAFAAMTATVSQAAKLMLDKGIGALPVLDAGGALVGMVSDGDLLGRRPEDDRRAWWLTMLAQGAGPVELPPQRLDRPISEVMSAPVLTVSPSTTLHVVAETMQLQKLKRLPVVENGRLVGIVSRGDLASHPNSAPQGAPPAPQGPGLLDFLESLIAGASLRGGAVATPAKQGAPPEAPKPAETFSAAALRQRAGALRTENRDTHDATQVAEKRERELRVKALLDRHVSHEMWRTLLQHAEAAAASGQSELPMLRFPCALCSDGGRRIDVGEEGWETTLRGEPAEFYARWRDELRPLGFRLAARIDSFEEGGVIGEVGLYLIWGE